MNRGGFKSDRIEEAKNTVNQGKGDGAMKPVLNPKHERGDRNVFCPYYGDCLDYAIEVSWLYWNCGDCLERANQAGMPDFQFRSSDTIEYLDIPLEIRRRA